MYQSAKGNSYINNMMLYGLVCTALKRFMEHGRGAVYRNCRIRVLVVETAGYAQKVRQASRTR